MRVFTPQTLASMLLGAQLNFSPPLFLGHVSPTLFFYLLLFFFLLFPPVHSSLSLCSYFSPFSQGNLNYLYEVKQLSSLTFHHWTQGSPQCSGPWRSWVHPGRSYRICCLGQEKCSLHPPPPVGRACAEALRPLVQEVHCTHKAEQGTGKHVKALVL